MRLRWDWLEPVVHTPCTAHPDLAELTRHGRELCAGHGAAHHRVIWYQQDPKGARGRLMLKTFTSRDQYQQSPAMDLTACPQADTFPAFAQQAGQDEFTFLHQRMTAGGARQSPGQSHRPVITY